MPIFGHISVGRVKIWKKYFLTTWKVLNISIFLVRLPNRITSSYSRVSTTEESSVVRGRSLAAGADIVELKKLLGHKRIESTERYLAVTPVTL